MIVEKREKAPLDNAGFADIFQDRINSLPSRLVNWIYLYRRNMRLVHLLVISPLT